MPYEISGWLLEGGGDGSEGLCSRRRSDELW